MLVKFSGYLNGLVFVMNVTVVNQKRVAKCLDLDDTAHNESSDLGLHCLQNYLSWSTGLKGLNKPFFLKFYLKK